MKYVTLIIAVFLPSHILAANYLCISDSANGYVIKDGSYEPAKFETGKRFVVSTDNRSVTKMGRSTPDHINCEDYSNRFFCSSQFGQFLMSKDHLKFMRYITTWAYVFNVGEDTPHIEVGTCVRL